MPLFTKKHRERTDNKKSFEKICPCEIILTGNSFFRVVDDRTRADIRRSLYRYANLHRLTLSEAASVLASHPDCMYKGKYAPYLRKEINTDPGERLPKVYMIFPESEAGSIEKKIAYLTRISHENQIGIIVVPSPSPTVFCKRDSDFAAFLSELYNRLTGRFGVSFEISVPTRGFDISKHVYRCPEDSDSLLYRALTETDIGIKLGGGERPPSSVILLGRNVSLSVDCVNILTRAAALERRRKGQNLVISALTEYYIPQRHTLFSAISCKYRSDAEHGASIINVPGFIAAYEKRSALPRAAVCRGAIAFVKKEHSPVRELSRLAAGEKTGLRRITTLPARLIWDTTCRLFPLFTLITLMITGTLYGRTAAVFLTVSLLLYSFYTCRGMVFGSFISAYPAVKAFLRALLAVIIRYLYYITLLPSLFAACLYGEVSYISKGHDERAVNKTPGSALTFFALSVISLVFGVIALAFAKSFFLRAFALSVTLCPLFTVLLSLERGEKRVSVSKLILTHAKRSYKTFRDFYEKKSPRLCEGEGILLEEGEFTPSDLGLSLAAYLAYHDLEIISLSELYSRLSDLFSILEGLTASDGLFYGSYRLSDRAAGVRTRISKEENGILLCCLIALREGLADLILPGDILLKRCDALIKRADLSLLSDPKINITGYGLLSDLLAFCSLQDKETTSGAYFAKKGVALTDGGSLDQLLLPYLFLPLFPYTQAAVGIRKHIIKNRRKAFRGMWGYTLSSSPEMDFLGEHIIKPDNGMPELAVYDGSKAGYISPYACFLTLGIRPVSSLLCLMKYSSHGMLGQGGFYDSLIPGENGLPFRIVRAYSLHNIAVSVIASANFQRGGIFIKRFCSSELIFPCLYRLRTKRIPIAGRSAQPLPVAKEEDLLESGDFGVPRIRLITNGIISLAASSEGHIWLFSKERDLTCFPFNPGDMGDISSSFSVLWSADGICRDAVGGRFLSDSDGALYIKNDGESVSFLKFTLSPDSGECRMTLTGKGNFDDSGIALSFKSGMSAKAGADGLYMSSGDSLFYVSCLSEGAEYSVEDGLCEICLLKASSGGFFSFDVLFRYTEDCIEYRRVTPIADRSGELTKSAILASYFLCAGGTRDGRGLEREEFTALFPSPTVALFTGAGAENYGMISEISDICRNMRLAGLDITLVICADDINDARLISFAGSEDILIAPDEKLSGLLRAFSVICFEKEDMISPERFLSGVMSASRRAKQYCRGGGTALGGALYTDALPVFSAGDDLLRLVCDEDGVFSLFYLETRIASEMTLSLGLEDGEHDIICSCFFAAHDRSVAVFKGMIGGEMITVGIFSDPEAEAIIIRVFAPRGRVGIDLVPLPDILELSA